MKESLLHRAQRLIPHGMYCHDENMRACPFWGYDAYLGVYHCAYMGKYGLPNHEVSDEIFEHGVYVIGEGDEDKFWEKCDLDLLWDQCKECGVNDELGADEQS